MVGLSTISATDAKDCTMIACAVGVVLTIAVQTALSSIVTHPKIKSTPNPTMVGRALIALPIVGALLAGTGMAASTHDVKAADKKKERIQTLTNGIACTLVYFAVMAIASIVAGSRLLQGEWSPKKAVNIAGIPILIVIVLAIICY